MYLYMEKGLETRSVTAGQFVTGDVIYSPRTGKWGYVSAIVSDGDVVTQIGSIHGDGFRSIFTPREGATYTVLKNREDEIKAYALRDEVMEG